MTSRVDWSDQQSDNDLLRLIAAQDRRAFACLMQRHGRLMMMVAQRTIGNAADADEVVQEAFLKVWLLASEWQPDGGAKFSTWFYRVVLNASLDRCRRKGMASLDDVDDPEDTAPGGFETVAHAQRHRMIVAAMADLSDKQNEALSLYYFGEMSAPDAARILDVSLSSFEALLFRGKVALKEALKRRGVTSLGEVL